MPEILTRRIGPFPGWVWAGAAVVGGLLFFYFRRQGQQSGQQGSLVNNPAASSIPYIPSVNLTGIPASSSAANNPASSTATASPPGAVWQFGPNPSRPYVWRVTQQGLITAQNKGVQLPPTVSPGPLGQDILQLTGPYGTQWAVVPSGSDPNTYAQQLNASTSGSGGWGYAGTGGLGVVPGGWTVGTWQQGGWPSGGFGAGSTVNRTGVARTPARLRRLYGGSGGGAKATKVSRPLRRRALSGR